MKEIVLLISCLYILPAVLSYLFVRKILIEENRDPDLKDVLFPFIPSLNVLIATLYLMFTMFDLIDGKCGKSAMRKFYRLK